MAQVITPPSQAQMGSSNPLDIPPRSIPQNTAARVPTLPASDASTARYVRNGHLTLDTFSPVHQNGSFAFDRVLKSGLVQKRTRKTKNWKSVYLVLRPNLLSIYKNEKEDKLRKQLNPSDLTAVAYLKDPKREHVFGLFSPSRNYHIEAASEQDAREWVELIRREARIEEEEEELCLASPGGCNGAYLGYGRHGARGSPHRLGQDDRLGSSSPEPGEVAPRTSTTRDGIRIPGVPRQNSNNLEYSGPDVGSCSDYSDTADPAGHLGSSWSLPHAEQAHTPYQALEGRSGRAGQRNASQTSGLGVGGQDDERVVWHGYLYILKSKRGVRQWKMLWAVLRPKHLAFYKNKEEYAANLLIPMTSMVDAVETDPVSKSKAHCLQLIAEERSYRLCAPDEDALAKWLGALKSLLAKNKRAAGTAGR